MNLHGAFPKVKTSSRDHAEFKSLRFSSVVFISGLSKFVVILKLSDLIGACRADPNVTG